MLLTLNAPSAYLPFNALANSSLVCVSGISFHFDCSYQPTRFPQREGMINQLSGKETKNTACDQPAFAKICNKLLCDLAVFARKKSVQARFLLGPAGSGKTFRCLAEIRAALAASPGRRPPLILLAPKQATFQLERQLLADGALPGYTRLQIFSFERLARFVLDARGVPLPSGLLAEEGRVMVLRALLLRHEERIEIVSPQRPPPRFRPATQPVARRTATASIHARQTPLAVPAHRLAPRTPGQAPRPGAAARRLHALARRTRIAGRKPPAGCGNRSLSPGRSSRRSSALRHLPSSISILVAIDACGSTALRK